MNKAIEERWIGIEYIIQEKRGSTYDLHWEDFILGIDDLERAIKRTEELRKVNPFGQYRLIQQETKTRIIVWPKKETIDKSAKIST